VTDEVQAVLDRAARAVFDGRITRGEIAARSWNDCPADTKQECYDIACDVLDELGAALVESAENRP